jgi:hypothetical protein
VGSCGEPAGTAAACSTSLGIIATILPRIIAGSFRADAFAVGTVATVAAALSAYLFTVRDGIRAAQDGAISARNRVLANR